MIEDLTAQGILFLVISLLVSMTVHEYMHSYVGYKLGDTTAETNGRLSLNPLRHIDPYMTILLPIVSVVLFKVLFLAAKPVPIDPDRLDHGEYGVALVSVAGPLSNLALAILGVVLLQRIDLSEVIQNFISIFIQVNIFVFIFNLIPIPPLDGSRVLYAFAPEPLQDFMRSIEPYGFFIVFGLVILGGFGHILPSLYNDVLSLISHT